jgi:hypothetical protein
MTTLWRLLAINGRSSDNKLAQINSIPDRFFGTAGRRRSIRETDFHLHRLAAVPRLNLMGLPNDRSAVVDKAVRKAFPEDLVVRCGDLDISKPIRGTFGTKSHLPRRVPVACVFGCEVHGFEPRIKVVKSAQYLFAADADASAVPSATDLLEENALQLSLISILKCVHLAIFVTGDPEVQAIIVPEDSAIDQSIEPIFAFPKQLDREIVVRPIEAAEEYPAKPIGRRVRLYQFVPDDSPRPGLNLRRLRGWKVDGLLARSRRHFPIGIRGVFPVRDDIRTCIGVRRPTFWR